MFTKEQLINLEPGDGVETGPLFSALSQENIYLVTELVSGTTGQDDRTVTFEASVYGIYLGHWACELKGDTMTWRFQ